jgi:hypothetical protein
MARIKKMFPKFIWQIWLKIVGFTHTNKHMLPFGQIAKKCSVVLFEFKLV